MLIGCHNSIAGGLHNAATEATLCGGEVMQIFCKNQRQWNAKPITDEQADLFKDAVQQAGLGPVMVHDSYLINMGNPDDAKRENARQAFQRELERCEALGVAYLNFHPGSHVHPDKKLRDDQAVRDAALDRIAEAVNTTHDEVPGQVKFVIENAAGQGTNVGTSWEEVGRLADAIDAKDRLGICIDTQHAWAAGHDWLGDFHGVWDRFDDQVGLGRLVAFHLNDSKQPLGARVDRHDHIGIGHLGEDFFRTLLTDGRFKDTSGYIETEGGPPVWQHEIALLKALRDDDADSEEKARDALMGQLAATA